MDSIPSSLIKSLNSLGLTNYEARVYAALVRFDHAEVKEIVEYLSISKPSVYEALDRLESMGLAVKRNSKPAMYGAVSPDIGLKIIIGNHEKAARSALKEFKKMEVHNIRTDASDALWTIYGDENIEYKIRNMFEHAKNQIDCMVGDRYLPALENIKMGTAKLRLFAVSDKPGIYEKLKNLFPDKNTEIHVISREKFLTPPPFAPPEFLELRKFSKFDTVLELNTDDEELLMVPPFISGTISVLNTRNKGAILHMKLFSQLRWKQFIDTEKHNP
jgi:sugar-specific transcriptional regulator TrmB